MVRRLFIGVVTHSQSRFHTSSISQLNKIVVAVSEAGWDVESFVSARDDYDACQYPINRRVLVRSATSQAALEYRWRRYLTHGERRGPVASVVRWVRDAALLLGTTFVRTTRYLAPATGFRLEDLRGTKVIVRLLNIDLSHLRILEAGVADGAQWILVLEDDAQADLSSVTSLLTSLESAEAAGADYITASRSIDHHELGISGLLEPAVDGHRRSRLPVTNTVCAVAYRRDTARWFSKRIVGDGLLPVIPIDWRLNRALMAAVDEGRMGDRSCWVLEPAPFTQGSMH